MKFQEVVVSLKMRVNKLPKKIEQNSIFSLRITRLISSFIVICPGVFPSLFSVLGFAPFSRRNLVISKFWFWQAMWSDVLKWNKWKRKISFKMWIQKLIFFGFFTLELAKVWLTSTPPSRISFSSKSFLLLLVIHDKIN